jgi:hypothetical protein
MLSPCCQAPIHEAFGEQLCSACYAVIAPQTIRIGAKRRDIMTWLFPAETGSPPKGEAVFVRVGKRIRRVDKIRGRRMGGAGSTLRASRGRASFDPRSPASSPAKPRRRVPDRRS